MRLTHKELKEAFLTFNLSLGRAFFKDYEIAHYLNNAYMICVNRRIGLFDERYVSSDKRITGITKPQEAPFPASYRTLLDFGKLYTASDLIKESGDVKDQGKDVGSCGAFTRLYKIPEEFPEFGDDGKMIGNKQIPMDEVPYLINVSLHEYSDAKPAVRMHSQLCRPVNPIDVTRMSLLYQDDKDMPYTYYRIRPIISFHTEKDANNKDVSVQHQHYYIEVSYEARNTASKIVYCTFDAIRWPRQFTGEDILEESTTKKVEVMFGYEIATTAAKLAMESLGSGRSSTL